MEYNSDFNYTVTKLVKNPSINHKKMSSLLAYKLDKLIVITVPNHKKITYLSYLITELITKLYTEYSSSTTQGYIVYPRSCECVI
jgi:hypothetical protein